MRKMIVGMTLLMTWMLFGETSMSEVRDVRATTREAKIKWFTDNCFGRRPVERPDYLKFEDVSLDKEMIGGLAIRRQVRIVYGGKYGTNSFVVTAFIPKSAQKKPCAAFLHVPIKADDGGYGYLKYCDPERNEKSEYHPVERVIKRGYAIIAFDNWDIAPDTTAAANRRGVFPCFEAPMRYRDNMAWGTISAWAWGASRVLDWLETVPEIDEKRVAVIGHSRGGKTALWAAVTDERFAMACVNGSGCAGAKLNRMNCGNSESIAVIVRTFQYWFCQNYTLWSNRDMEVPFDQHELLACVAPRLLAVGSGSEDLWAGPAGEKMATELAAKAWEDPSRVHYHCHKGPHNLGIDDWDEYMNFADGKL